MATLLSTFALISILLAIAVEVDRRRRHARGSAGRTEALAQGA